MGELQYLVVRLVNSLSYLVLTIRCIPRLGWELNPSEYHHYTDSKSQSLARSAPNLAHLPLF